MICGAAGDVFQHLGGFCIINPIFSAQRESDGIQVHAQTTETGDVVLAVQSKAGFGVEMIADNYRKMYMVCGQNWAALLASPGRKQQNNFSAVGPPPTALIPAVFYSKSSVTQWFSGLDGAAAGIHKSKPPPLECHSSALPAELYPQNR